MWRTVVAVIVGYIAIFCFTAGSFTVAFLLLGVDGSFQPGTYDITPTWGITAIVLSLVAALVGGAVCGLIARPGSKAPHAFAAVVFLLGVISAATQGAREVPDTREADVAVFEAASNAKQPAWYAWSLPVIGALGTFAGASLVLGIRKRGVAAETAQA